MFKPASYLFIINASLLSRGIIIHFCFFFSVRFFLFLIRTHSACISALRLLFGFSGQVGQHLLPQGFMSDHGAVGELHYDVAARAHAHVDETKWLWNPSVVKEEGQVVILGLHVLCDLVFDPLEGDSLLVDRLEEDFIGSLHLEEQLHIVSSDGILKFLFSRLAIRIGQRRHIDHI